MNTTVFAIIHHWPANFEQSTIMPTGYATHDEAQTSCDWFNANTEEPGHTYEVFALTVRTSV